MLCPQTWPTWQGDDAKGCRAILAEQRVCKRKASLQCNAVASHDRFAFFVCQVAEGQQYQLGKTKVFIRNPVTLFQLEELRERKLHDIVCCSHALDRV